jgi:hypothetical protein
MYLLFNKFKSGFCQTNREFEERLRTNPLYDYTAQNWGHHAHSVSSYCKGVVQFLDCNKKVKAASQALMAAEQWSRHSRYSQEVPKHIRGLHLTAYFGIESAT